MTGPVPAVSTSVPTRATTTTSTRPSRRVPATATTGRGPRGGRRPGQSLPPPSPPSRCLQHVPLAPPPSGSRRTSLPPTSTSTSSFSFPLSFFLLFLVIFPFFYFSPTTPFVLSVSVSSPSLPLPSLPRPQPTSPRDFPSEGFLNDLHRSPDNSRGPRPDRTEVPSDTGENRVPIVTNVLRDTVHVPVAPLRSPTPGV